MGPRIKKSRKNHHRRGERHDLDRLSNLPDSILTHIFSFLDFDSVVRTSVLSKRYKNLWTISPCLDFKLSEPKNDKILRYDDRFPSAAREARAADFELYVNRILQLREHTNLERFTLSLSLHKGVRPEFVLHCLSYAVEHKVQDLKLRGFFRAFALPRLLLESPPLISLSLHNATVNGIGLPMSVSLPNLKALNLKNFDFSYFSSGLFSGCPNLETLVLSKCSMRSLSKLKFLDFNCLNLKHLEIDRWRCSDNHLINLDAPKLAFLKFHGSLVRVNFKDVLHCVETACFELRYPTACAMIDIHQRRQKIAECVLDMLLNVRSVKVLSLSLMTIEVEFYLNECCVTAFGSNPTI